MDFYYHYQGLIIILFILLGIAACVGLAFIPANIAKKKGYSYGGFWAFGFFLFVPALIVALLIDDKTLPPPYYGNPYYGPYGQQPPPPPPYGPGPYGQYPPPYGQPNQQQQAPYSGYQGQRQNTPPPAHEQRAPQSDNFPPSYSQPYGRPYAEQSSQPSPELSQNPFGRESQLHDIERRWSRGEIPLEEYEYLRQQILKNTPDPRDGDNTTSE